MLEFVAETARRPGLDDYRVVVNVGEGAGQTVFHLHWHVLGGQVDGGGRHEPDRPDRGRAEGGDARAGRRAARRAAPDPVGLRSAEKELQRPLTTTRSCRCSSASARSATEAAEAFRAAGREEQAEAEERELAVLEEFMPEPLSEDELEEIVDDAIAEVGATSMRDLGRVMADVMPQIAGRADGSAVSQLVREKLA